MLSIVKEFLRFITTIDIMQMLLKDYHLTHIYFFLFATIKVMSSFLPHIRILQNDTMITKETSSPLDSSAKYGDTPILLQQPLEVVESSSTNSNHNNSTTNATDHLNMNEIKEKSSNRNDSITKRQLIGLDDENGEDRDEGGGKDEEDQGVAVGGDDDEDDDRPSRSDLVQLPVSEMPPLPIDDTKESPTKASSSMKFEWPLLFERFVNNNHLVFRQ